ncbi:MAG: GerMN domain-containing protein [Ilumatobacteraceae bacterium]
MNRLINPRLSVFILSIALSACAIGSEASPRRIDADPSRNSNYEVASNDATTGIGRIYLQRTDSVGESSLVAVQRDVPVDASAILISLFEGPSADEQQAGLRSAIPRGTELRSVRFVATGTLRADISAAIFDATGDDLVSAMAQIVLTLSDIDGVEQVAVTVDGRETEWPRGDGTLVSRPLTAFDFPGRAVSSQPDYPTIIAPADNID